MIEQTKCIKQYTFNALNIIKEISHGKVLYFYEILHIQFWYIFKASEINYICEVFALYGCWSYCEYFRHFVTHKKFALKTRPSKQFKIWIANPKRPAMHHECLLIGNKI